MNISVDVIKQYAEARQKLMDSGVIGGYLPDGNLHVRYSTLVDEEGVVVKPRKCEQYPYEISVMVDGIKIFGILKKNLPNILNYKVIWKMMLIYPVVAIMLHDLEHPAIYSVNRTGYVNISNQPECCGFDVFGDEVLSGDSVVFDGDEMILIENLERYLSENYDFKFQTIE
jgi:hypothetical protein